MNEFIEFIVTLALSLATILPVFPAGDAAFVHECVGIDYPAILHAYDPALGGINCDGDCTTVATGKFTEDMYGVAGACPVSMLGATVSFNDIGVSMKCVDTGGGIKPAWSERDNMCVVYFDILFPLEKKDGVFVNAPYWNHWLLPDWSMTWEN